MLAREVLRSALNAGRRGSNFEPGRGGTRAGAGGLGAGQLFSVRRWEEGSGTHVKTKASVTGHKLLGSGRSKVG